LANLDFNVDIAAIPEGSIVSAHEPLLRITGPIIPCQLLETALLTIVNFQTLIATKSARVCRAAGGDDVLEFGLRRAQGFDGGISATRAAFIGGVTATSNVLAAQLLNIPVKGTHAHSWVMMFESEKMAFESYAKAMPNNCVFLVDTYDSIQGIHNAIEVATELRKNGHEIVGIRLDSGDLADLSIQGRRILDAAGFHNAKIIASDSLNEDRIQSLKQQGAKIDIWGVGTNLVTAQDQPALGGVYKLAALRKDPQSDWQPKIKRSNSLIKISNPGHLQVRRYFDKQNKIICDVIYDTHKGCSSNWVTLSGEAIHIDQSIHHSTSKELLQHCMQNGQRLHSNQNLQTLQEQCLKALQSLHTDTDGQDSEIPVYLDEHVWHMKAQLLIQNHSQ